jgi:hypothetical protein
MTKTIDERLSNEPTEAVEAQAAEPAPEAPGTPEEAPSGPARDEHGRFAAKTGDEEQAQPAEPTPGNPIPDDQFKGYLTEKRKRQEAEERLSVLEQQLQQLQQPQEPPASPPSVWENEQAFGEHLTGQAVNRASFNARLDVSEMLADQAHEDFDEMKARFIAMMEQNPALQQQALAAKHPWEKAYQIAANAAKMEALGAVNVADLEAKIEARVREEMMGSSPVPQPQPTVPVSLTGERNVGSRSGPAWAGPKTLEERLRH